MAGHDEQADAPEDVEDRTEKASLPVGLTHKIKLLLPVVKRAIIAVVDLPAKDSFVTIANVLPGADAIGGAGTQGRLRELASVDLLLDEEGDEVDEEGADDVRAHAKGDIDDHVEEADASGAFKKVIDKFVI